MISEKDKNIILAYAKKYKSEKVIYPPPTLADQARIATELEQKMNEVEKIRQIADRELEAISSLPGAILREVFDFEEEEVS